MKDLIPLRDALTAVIEFDPKRAVALKTECTALKTVVSGLKSDATAERLKVGKLKSDVLRLETSLTERETEIARAVAEQIRVADRVFASHKQQLDDQLVQLRREVTAAQEASALAVTAREGAEGDLEAARARLG